MEQDISGRKQLLRRQALARRRRLGAEERSRLATVVTERALALDEVTAARVVLAFASFGTEIATDALISRLLESGAAVLLPAVDGHRLRALPIASLEEVAPGYRGIREPVRRDLVAPEADAIFVPGIAFDVAGRRLGYGGGFYDRFLASAQGVRIGLAFELQVVDEVPAASHDEAVDVVVTEERVIRARR